MLRILIQVVFFPLNLQVSFSSSCQVGPTAKEQNSRTDRSVEADVADELDQYAVQILPSLTTTGHCVVGDYVGIRPATTIRDYQIHAYHACSWITVAGIRSTGLTASLGIGRHVLHLLRSILPPPPQRTTTIRTTPLPPVVDLVQNYRERQDGKVTIHGYDYKVTHPITRFGWDAGLGIAKH
jgi:glycerol-3-phosphate dehydrogenase